MTYDEDTGSYVAHFRAEDKFYEHQIFTSSDDRVECIDQEGDTVLTFTANCDVFIGKTKEAQIGRFTMNNDNTWSFMHGKDWEEVIHSKSWDLLKFEVEISKAYIKGEL